MAISNEQWMLFGYDVRDTGRLWLAAWRDFLWTSSSPVRSYLDDLVTLEDGTRQETFHAGEPVDHPPVSLRAVALPEDLVLVRNLTLPEAALANFDSVLELEVGASSPFSDGDTAYGWKRSSGAEGQIDISLVIVSRSAVMSYLSSHYDLHDPQDREVWAPVHGSWVLVRGFGEMHRDINYRRRLVRTGFCIAAVAALVLAIALVHMGFKRIELGQLEALASLTQRDTATAMELRDQLASVSGTANQVNQLLDAYPSPHLELARLTALLGDDTYIEQFQMTGRELRLRGRAADAAAVMQLLTEQPAYETVTAPQAITRVAGAGVEVFHLQITLAERASGGVSGG